MKKVNLIISGSKEKPITFDINYNTNNYNQPVILFIHGLKGFKDWGHFNLIAEAFVQKGFVVVKMNTSYNGTTPERLTEFADLEAFGNNNFCIELDDIDIMLQFIQDKIHHYFGDKNNISLIGHSRGGGLALIAASNNDAVKKVVTWATVHNFGNFFKDTNIAKWKEDGVIYSLNTRTQQEMPFYYQLYDNYINHTNKLDIENAVAKMQKPLLLIHGSKDISVHPNSSIHLHQLNQNSKLEIIDNAEHTFGGKEPFDSIVLPNVTNTLIEITINFLLA